MYRLTDSGSDNDAKEAHALHVQLVSRGILQKLIWVRQPPKHSHNLADRVNSMVKECIWPKKGTGGGCRAPWDMEDIVAKALKSQAGRTELAWHWQNCDFKKLYDGHFHSGFGFYKEERYWVYEYDQDLSNHHYCRVIHRSNLLPHDSTSVEPEFFPCVPTEQGELLTRKEGLLLMKSLPDVTVECPIEPWLFSEKSDAEGVAQDRRNEGKKMYWSRKKVFSDIRDHVAAAFPAAQQEQWAALDHFHTLYPTSDSLPTALPITLTPEGAQKPWVMQRGTPIDWNEAWRGMTLRYSRPHAHQLNAHVAPTAAAPPPSPTIAPVGDKGFDVQTQAALLNRVTGAILCPHTKKTHVCLTCVPARSLPWGKALPRGKALGSLQ